jgi:hypothetical protein
VDSGRRDNQRGPDDETSARKQLDRYYPDVVAIGADGPYHCTGILVATNVVLTARHCLPAHRVLAGSSIERPDIELQVVRSSVPEDPALDVALLRLNQHVQLPIRPRRSALQQAGPLGVVRLVGFGATDSQGRIGFGRKRMVDILIRGWGCDGYRAHQTGCLVTDELAIPSNGGRDACDGDSGGPVLERSDAGWRLLAITSRPLFNTGPRCGNGGIYVRVDRLAAWIDAQLQVTDDTAPKENAP